jgi:hypothetical protein
MSVKHDIFPAFVALLPAEDPTPLLEMKSGPLYPKTARQLLTARVVVFNNRVTIAVDSNDGPRIVFNQAVDPSTFQKGAKPSEDSFIQTLKGIKIAYRKDENCGCGSRLRSWNPYRILNSTKDPTE